MKKILIPLLVFFLLFVLSGCNNATIEGNLVVSNNIDTTSNVNPLPPQTLRTNELGSGTVEYTLIDSQVGKTWQDFGINEKDVTESGKDLDNDKSIVLLTINVNNIDISFDGTDSNINCLGLIDNNELSNANPEDPILIMPLSYFDLAPDGSLEPGRMDYAHYRLPDIGTSREIKIGFVLPTSLIENNELSLIHTYMGLEDATTLPLDLS